MTDEDFIVRVMALRGDIPKMREFLKIAGHLDRLFDLAIQGVGRKTQRDASGRRGTRWASDREVPGEWLDSAAARRAKAGLAAIDLRHVAEEFVTYWPSVAGKAGIKLDWKLTFENRCLQARAPAAPYMRFGVVEGATFENTDIRGWIERLRVHAGHYEGGEGGSPAGSWSPKWGSAPGHPGSKVPPEASAEFGRRYPQDAAKTAL